MAKRLKPLTILVSAFALTLVCPALAFADNDSGSGVSLPTIIFLLGLVVLGAALMLAARNYNNDKNNSGGKRKNRERGQSKTKNKTKKRANKKAAQSRAKNRR